MSAKDKQTLAAFGQLNRDDEFRVITKVMSHDSRLTVCKEAYSGPAIKHVERMIANHKKLEKGLSSFPGARMVDIVDSGKDYVEFEYINGHNVENQVFNLVLLGDYKEVISFIDRIFSLVDHLSSKRQNSDETDTVKAINDIYALPSSSTKYVNPGVIDLNLDNFILDSNDILVAFDYEWTFDQPIAAEYVKTRLLYTFFARRSEAFAFLPSASMPFKTVWEGNARALIPLRIFSRYSKLFSEDSMRKYWEAEDVFQRSVSSHRLNTAGVNIKNFRSEDITTPQLTFPETEEVQRNHHDSIHQTLLERTQNLENELQLIKSSNTYRVAKKMASAKGRIYRKQP